MAIHIVVHMIIHIGIHVIHIVHANVPVEVLRLVLVTVHRHSVRHTIRHSVRHTVRHVTIHMVGHLQVTTCDVRLDQMVWQRCGAHRHRTFGVVAGEHAESLAGQFVNVVRQFVDRFAATHRSLEQIAARLALLGRLKGGDVVGALALAVRGGRRGLRVVRRIVETVEHRRSRFAMLNRANGVVVVLGRGQLVGQVAGQVVVDRMATVQTAIVQHRVGRAAERFGDHL